MLALLAAPAAASALDYPVNNISDSGTDSLRAAIDNANANPGTDTITINTTGTVALLSALPLITESVTIAGPGHNQFTVNGADSFQVLRIQNGTVAISGLTITNGHACNSICTTGGGIFNATGTVTLSDVVVRNSVTIDQGGGIYNGGTMTLSNSTVSSNTAAQTGGSDAFPEGGGIWNDGTLTLTQSNVSGNTASSAGASNQNAPNGGGIYNNTNGTLTVDQTTIDSNHATADAGGAGGTTSAYGGGIFNSGALIMLRSTLSNNTASGTNGTFNSATAGGIGSTPGSSTTMKRTTVGGNAVTASNDHSGGGLELDGTGSTITSSTIAHNSAGTGANLDAGGDVTLKNTILSNPQVGTNCSGTPTISPGYNIADDASCRLLGTGDQPSTDPKLAASLASNGGPTQTYKLNPTSPGVDKGLSSAGENTDQRGDPRPTDFASIPNATSGDGTDIGAYEVQDVTPPLTTIDTGPANGSTINDPTPTFAFAVNEPATFQCRTDGAPFDDTFIANCTSPKTVMHLSDGAHTFRVRASDAAGNLSAAASRSFTVKTAEVKRSGSTLTITAAPGAKDNLKITRSPSTVTVTDLPAGSYTGSGVHTGPGCTRSGDYTATCAASAITAVNVSSGSLADRVLNTTALPSTIDGGPGADALTGGQGKDTVKGGAGADAMQGGGGNDVLLARDRTSDSVIDCDGSGPHPGTGDKASLDAPPKDAHPIGCEIVTRP